VDTRTAQPIEIAITTTAGKVEGTVRDANGKPAPPATVVVMPLAERRDNPALFREPCRAKMAGSPFEVSPRRIQDFCMGESSFGEPWRNAEFMDAIRTARSIHKSHVQQYFDRSSHSSWKGRTVNALLVAAALILVPLQTTPQRVNGVIQGTVTQFGQSLPCRMSKSA
jgi:hypothetical protein